MSRHDGNIEFKPSPHAISQVVQNIKSKNRAFKSLKALFLIDLTGEDKILARYILILVIISKYLFIYRI